MATANTITDAAYKKCGILSPDDTQDADALEALNNMVSAWGLEHLSPYKTRENFPLVSGTAEYTIGDGGDFDTVRPIRILNCYLTDSSGYSYPVGISLSAKDYNRINLKTAESRPTKLYFLTEYPLAKIIFNYEADAVYTAYFEFEKQITEFAALTTTVTLPNEYKEALIYNLAVKLAEDDSIQLPPSVTEAAGALKFLISRMLDVNRSTPISRFEMNGYSSLNITTGE